jgi:hypothetical protein
MRRAPFQPIFVPLIVIALLLTTLGGYPALPAAGDARAAGPDPSPPSAPGEGVCRDMGKIMISDRARIERGQTAQATGTILSASGGFSARPVDAPCDPAPAIAPVDVTAGGTVRIVLDGSPAVPCTWSLGNSGTGFALDYQPAMGRNFGPAQRLAATNLTCESEPETATHVEITAEVPGPGRLQAYVGAPGGNGPLSSSCFEQSFSASVEMVEVRPEAPAVDGMALSSGDRLVTENGGYAVLSFPPGTSVLVHSDVTLGYFQPESGLAGDTPVLETPARLNAWLQQYQDARLPLPINADYSAYRDATSLAALKLADSQDLCEGGMEVKLFLDTQQGQWTAEKLAKNAWTVFGKDEYDALEFVAKRFAQSLVPVAGVLGTIDDVADLVGIVYEEWQNQRASALFEPALAAWRDSRAWDKAKLQERLDALAQSRASLDDEMRQAQDGAARTIQSEWDQFLQDNPLIWEKWRAEQNGKIVEWGPADVQRLQDFNARQREIMGEAQSKIADLMYQRKAVSIEDKVLREYRAPLMEKGCDAFLKDLLTQPPVIGPCRDGASVLQLNSGSLRYVHHASAAAGPQVRVGGRTIVPDGTEFVAETTETGARVAVIEGRVTLYEPGGKPVQLEAGQQLEWPGDVLSDYDLAEDDGGPVGGVPLRHIPLDDETPLPPGRYGAGFANGRLPEDWLWQDPGDDATLETPEPGVLRVSVPDGNELWGGSVTAPRLLHRVSGDFDLQGEMFFETQASHFAISEFLLYAPGGYLGYLAHQTDPGGATAHYRILGGGWRMEQGSNMLLSLPCILPYWNPAECPAAPGSPVQLKLTRRGDVWRTYWSADGEHWLLSGMQEILAPDTVWVGWLFKRIAYDGLGDVPALTTLRDVRLVSVPRDLAPPPEWEAITPGQPVETRDGIVRLALDGSRPGSVRAQYGQRLEGDFDAVVRLDPQAWTRQPGETHSFEVSAVAIDELSRVYAAFNETGARRVFNTDMEINQGWYRYNEVPTEADPATWLRISRRDAQVDTYFWSDCQWQPLGDFRDPLPDPLFLRLAVGNEWEATAPAPVAAGFSLAYLLTGEEAAAAEWGSDGCVPVPAGSSPAEGGATEASAGGQAKSDHDIRDDFSTKKFAWCVAEDDIAISGYEDGAYFMHALQPNYRTLCFAPVSFFPTGGEFDARVPEEYRGGTFGLLCHYDPPGDFYSIEFDLDSRSLYLRQRLDGESLPLTDPEWIDLVHLKPSASETNHFQVTCDPDLIRVFVNGELEADLPLDPPAKPGDMALFVKGWESMGPRGYKVLFDNFRAWEEVQ